jgi:hypothetical protein
LLAVAKPKPFPTTAVASLHALGVGSGFASFDTGGLWTQITELMGCEWFRVGSAEWLQHVVRLDWIDAPNVVNIDRDRIIETSSGFVRVPLSPSSGHHLPVLPPLLGALVAGVSSGHV